jgi:hypothetical protein
MKNIRISLIIDRQVTLVIGAAIGTLLIGMIGVSAHAGPQPILQLAGVREVQTYDSDAASGARTGEKDLPVAVRTTSTEKSASTRSARSTTAPAIHTVKSDGSQPTRPRSEAGESRTRRLPTTAEPDRSVRHFSWR